MPPEDAAPAAETTTPEVVETQTVETDTPPAEPQLTLAQALAQIEAEKAKTARAVAAEQTARQKRQELEGQLSTLTAAEQQREAERVANLSLSEKLAEEQTKRQAAEARATRVESEWGDFRIETELSQAGFLTGLEGDAKAAQLGTLKALTRLDFVQENGTFSVEKFAERFGGLKPQGAVAVTVADPAPTVVDLGGKTAAPAEKAVARKTELLAQRETAMKRGQRGLLISIDRELSKLK